MSGNRKKGFSESIETVNCTEEIVIGTIGFMKNGHIRNISHLSYMFQLEGNT